MSVFDDDLDTMFGDDFPAVSMTFGGTTAEAFPEVWDQEVMPGMEKGVVGEVLTLQFPTSRFPGLEIGSAVVADGVNYIVRDRRRAPESIDGMVTQILLKRAS